jgi:hypothetical protein
MDNNTPHIAYQDDLSQRNLKKKKPTNQLKKRNNNLFWDCTQKQNRVTTSIK